MEPPNLRSKSICLPFEREAEYRVMVEDPVQFRRYLEEAVAQYPELFPAAISGGFTWHSFYHSAKQEIRLRRLELVATAEVFLVRPSFLLPYLVAKTVDVEKALYLRRWGVPFEALAYVFGGNAMFYYRAWLALGRPALVGTTVKDAAKLPRHLVADEKHSWVEGAKVYLPTTAAAGLILGVSVVSEAATEALAKGYGEFVSEAREVAPDYEPETVCTDGWKATREAWRQLFPKITLILCFLHAILKIVDRCRAQVRDQITQQAWHIYHAASKREFAQRLRRFVEWGRATCDKAAVLEAILKMWHNRPEFLKAYDFAQAQRTTNGVDRLMDYQDRMLYQMRYFHGTPKSARLAARAMALQWNFHPYSARIKRTGGNRSSPFSDLNGFQYHDNWLHNLLIASSLGGHRL